MPQAALQSPPCSLQGDTSLPRFQLTQVSSLQGGAGHSRQANLRHHCPGLRAMPGCACREEPETFGGGYEKDMDLPGAAPAGPAGEPEVDYNLGLGGYDAWEAPEMPERFEDVTLDSGLLPGAEEPAIGAGVSAKGPDRAAAQNGESALTCFL